MNSYRQNSDWPRNWGRSKGRRRLIAATVLVLFLLLLDALLSGALRNVARAAGARVYRAGAAVKQAVLGSGMLSTRRALETENARLSQEIARLFERVAAYEALKDENASLRGLLRVAGDSGGGITAPIISSLSASPYGTFAIGAGSVDAVSSGSLVLSAENFVIGTVTDVDTNRSLVKEVFASGQETGVIVSGVAISLEGQGGANARARAPRDANIAQGDIARAPSFGGRAIGTVGAIESDLGGAYKTVYVRLPVNLSQLQFVYVITR